MKVYILLLISALLSASAFGNSDDRNWKFKDGKKLRAELVSVNSADKTVEFLINDKDSVVYDIEEFSEVDIAWIYEWTNIDAELQGILDEVKGELVHKVHEGTEDTDVFTYYPSTYTEEDAKNFPLMILFHAGGKALRYITRHIEAAEETEFIVVTLGQFRNTGDNDKKEAAFLARYKEVFAFIQEEIVFDPGNVYMGGISGGAWKAYHYTAWIDYPWAGIYANGGWLGVPEKYHGLDYRDDMKVAMVNGNNDRNANRVVERDLEVLKKHNADVSIISFEGGHQIAPTKIQVRAFKWLLNPDEFSE